MFLSVDPAYIAEQNNIVEIAWKFKYMYQNKPRMLFLHEFCSNFKKILSVGCGSYEPLVIGATHAIDVSPRSYHYLTLQGWTGEFKLASCDDIPYPSGYFDVVICSEVIEHLPDLDDVERTFAEVSALTRNFIFTTPCNPLGPKNTEATHKRAFTLTQLKDYASRYGAKIYKDAIYYYIVRDATKTSARLLDKYAIRSAEE